MGTIPALEERFLKPPGWEWGFFEPAGRKIRFGFIRPKTPVATVVCLTGLSEFAEKYFETARTLLDINCTIYVMDWVGQGRSGRYLENPHKRHSLGFEHDVHDLHEFITHHVKPDGPLFLLAHSMGGNIGLHYLHQHPHVFKAAAFSAPMCGIKAIGFIPISLRTLTTGALNMFASESYVGGDGDWREDMRELKGFDPFSSDPVRRKIHNAWCLADPHLQVGRVTWGWVHQAVQSCLRLHTALREKPLTTPCLFAIAGTESFVDNPVSRRIAGYSKTTRILEFPDSRHEILMERDAIRGRFFEAFARLLQETIP
ncbi:MAG: alpha/beta fold hydrolase [Alphaproteobacteria bacterium]